MELCDLRQQEDATGEDNLAALWCLLLFSCTEFLFPGARKLPSLATLYSLPDETSISCQDSAKPGNRSTAVTDADSPHIYVPNFLITHSLIRTGRKMQQYVASTTSFCFLLCCCCCLFPASPGGGGTSLRNPTASRDIIDQTCNKCSELSQTFSYAFCSVSLGQIPVAHFTNLEGLAIISMELALKNATNTVSTIRTLLEDESLDPFMALCLKGCLALYGGTIPTLVDSIGAFMVGQYGTAGMWLSGVMEAATTCEDGFRGREGVASPLAQENWSLFQLSDIAICIIHLLSPALIPSSELLLGM